MGQSCCIRWVGSKDMLHILPLKISVMNPSWLFFLPDPDFPLPTPAGDLNSLPSLFACLVFTLFFLSRASSVSSLLQIVCNSMYLHISSPSAAWCSFLSDHWPLSWELVVKSKKHKSKVAVVMLFLPYLFLGKKAGMTYEQKVSSHKRHSLCTKLKRLSCLCTKTRYFVNQALNA